MLFFFFFGVTLFLSIFRAHWKFLKTVVNKLFEFMHGRLSVLFTQYSFSLSPSTAFLYCFLQSDILNCAKGHFNIKSPGR